MKILHILNTSAFSGAENMVCQIIYMLKNVLHYDSVYCSFDGSIREALNERSIEFSPVSKMSVTEIKRVIRENKPDVVHAHDMKAAFVASFACGKTRLVFHIHNNSFESRRMSKKTVAFLLSSVKAKHIFWVSDSAKLDYFFSRFIKKKSSVLYNIIISDLLIKKMNLDTNNYNCDVVFLGRLSEEKNPIRMLEVFERVINVLPNIVLGIIGSGPLEEELKKRAFERRIDNRIVFFGFQKNPLKILHDAKVMIMTSSWEGLPICALEAQALGVPIVSTPTDGLIKLIEDGENGFLSDDDDVLANRVISILSNKELYKKLSQNQIAKSIQFNNETKYVETLNKIYCE